MQGLEGKVALVTGGAKNIGKGISLRLAREGVAVVLAGRSAGAAQSVVDEISSAGGRAAFVACDLTDPLSAETAVAFAKSHFGRLDFVVNNAAATYLIRNGEEHGPAEETLEVFDDFLKVGLYGPFLLAKAALPMMIAQGGGVFVNISSVAAGGGQLGSTAYGPSKAALDSLTLQLAANYGKDGVRAVSLRVGLVRTDENHLLHDHPEAGPLLRDTQMLPQIGTPADVAGAVAFMVSEDAAFITGTILNVDGGQASKIQMPDVSAIFARQRATAR